MNSSDGEFSDPFKDGGEEGGGDSFRLLADILLHFDPFLEVCGKTPFLWRKPIQEVILLLQL